MFTKKYYFILFLFDLYFILFYFTIRRSFRTTTTTKKQNKMSQTLSLSFAIQKQWVLKNFTDRGERPMKKTKKTWLCSFKKQIPQNTKKHVDIRYKRQVSKSSKSVKTKIPSEQKTHNMVITMQLSN